MIAALWPFLKVLMLLAPEIWRFVRDNQVEAKGAKSAVSALLLLHANRVARAQAARADETLDPENDPNDRSLR